MNIFEVPLELRLRQEATQRLLTKLFEDQEWEDLLQCAEILNQAWHQQSAVAKWFAKEAADNLGEAWQSGRVHRPEHDGSGC